mgnify:CR=1 FL=1
MLFRSVKVMEERTVGPSLGADSIRQGLFSMIVGSILVVVFMVVYYNVSGLIADVALILNILLIAAGLAAFQATLTMPGIAGIILTIGMAVDANVLVFERIREELRIGKTQHSAVSAGYERATLTIMDANITTLIAPGALSVRYGARQGLRRHPEPRRHRQPVHGAFRDADHLRLSARPPSGQENQHMRRTPQIGCTHWTEPITQG